MKRIVMIGSASVLCAFGLQAATNGVEKTMVVQRCLAVDRKGNQCKHRAEGGQLYCWRHRGLPKVLNDTMDDAGKGANESWQATKQWSTNTWRKTKDGAKSAWDATVDAADKARVGLVEILGGQDASKKKSK